MLKGINPGRLDTKITIEMSAITTNGIGEEVNTWSTYKVCQAEKKRRASNEVIEGKQVVSSDNTEYNIRYDSGIRATMRIKEMAETTYYYITDVLQWKREGYTQMIGEKRDNN